MPEQNPATAGKPEVSPEPEQDFASYEKAQHAELMGDPAPAVEEEKQPAAKAEEPEPEPAPASDPDEEDQEKPGSQRLQKRFDKLTRRIHELEARLQQPPTESKPGVVPEAVVEKPKAAEGKPTPPDPNTWKGTWDELETAKIDYLEQLADWKVEQREKARETAENQRKAAETQKQLNDTWVERVKALKEVHPDYEDVLRGVEIDIPPALDEAIRTSEHGPAMVYHLASNPDEARRIVALPAIAAVRELGKLEAQFVQQSTPETPKSRVSKAPTPPKPVKGTGGSVSRIDGDIPFSEYEPLRMAQERRR